MIYGKCAHKAEKAQDDISSALYVTTFVPNIYIYKQTHKLEYNFLTTASTISHHDVAPLTRPLHQQHTFLVRTPKA